ncbi:MAG TPA: IPT/TIG domain-containing protein [Bryobacteraceae bacterium]|nr:IPT/TIG domain-containing protein [Bryobacteraceae bacterium]
MRGRGLLLGFAAFALPLPAYYHFIHYLNGVNVPEKYDLTTLPSSTVTFFVSETGPTTFNQTDTFNSVLTQIQQATQVWNGVSASALRVAFGGLENASTPQNTPAADVIFEDLPPGLYGYGGPTSSLAAVTPTNGAAFIPIQRSTVHLNRNLTVLPGPSYASTFFMTVVHEMGHALGLQHTFTSATMSQATTRATTLSHPLDADDIAGLAVLYPTSSFGQFGTITGQITTGRKAMHMASVVAIHPGWGAVSAMTNPDGTYQIQGLPPGPYYVYAHSIPPDANIMGPWAQDGTVVPPSAPTTAVFYANSSANPAPLSIQAGKTRSSVNIDLPGRSSVELYDVQIYGYFNYNNASIAVYPAYLDMISGYTAVNATGNGLGPNLTGVQIMGGNAYAYGTTVSQANGEYYATIDVAFSLGAATGPQHLIFNTADYMYVAPAGITLTKALPPTVTAVTANGDGTATITGTNWAADSLIYFDGLPASIASLDPAKGTATVTPPPGSTGQTSVVTVYNSDGQNSQFLQLSSPPTYAYGSAGSAVIASISPAALPAGAEAMVDITGTGFTFAPGRVSLGFGTSDITVRRVYVLSQAHIQADVSIAPGAALSNPDVSLMSGFQLATVTAGFQITAAVPNLPAAVPSLFNAITGLNGSYAGAIVSLYGRNLAVPNGTTSVLIGGQQAGILYSSPSQINLQIPAGLQPGPAVLALNNGAVAAYPVVVSIDPTPAMIATVHDNNGAAITPSNPAHPGDYITLGLSGFGSGGTIDPSRVQIGVAGAMQNAVSVTAQGDVYQVAFTLSSSVPIASNDSLIVYLDGHSSYPATIAIANANNIFSAPAVASSGN